MNRCFVLALGLLAVVACSSSEPDDDDDEGGSSGSYCDTFLDRMRDCDVVGAGRLTCTNYEDAAEQCETQCLKAATCGGIADFYCLYEGPVTRCFNACIGIQPLSCDDGTVLDWRAKCNGVEECAGGEDELDCTTLSRYKCRNVDTFVDYTLVCDGVEDCGDGSDELADCEVELVCSDGLEVTKAQVCNGYQNCSDGSDEASDCAVSTCG